MAALEKFANPARFARLVRPVLPFAAALTLIGLVAGIWWGLFVAPPDHVQGETARIMYVHVPSAWLSMLSYFLLAACGAAFLIWKHPLADIAGEALAPLGTLFTVLALVSGSIWGQVTWGTWWEWDARMTSVLVQLFLFLGYMGLRGASDDASRNGRAAALLAVVGIINLPIIRFSVDWWNTLHQPASVLREGGSRIHPDQLYPLLVMALAFHFYLITVWLWRLRAIALERRALNLRLSAEAAREEGTW